MDTHVLMVFFCHFQTLYPMTFKNICISNSEEWEATCSKAPSYLYQLYLYLSLTFFIIKIRGKCSLVLWRSVCLSRMTTEFLWLHVDLNLSYLQWCSWSVEKNSRWQPQQSNQSLPNFFMYLMCNTHKTGMALIVSSSSFDFF